MVDKPLVSVITPSFNQGAYIEQTITSIMEQEYPHVEHIIVDGGSTDETLDVLRRYEGTYRMRWLSEPDGGMYEAINKGLRMANGDILAYLNSDDLYFPWTVETVVKALTEYRDAGLVFGDMLNVEDDSNQGRVFFYPPFRLDYVQRSGFLGQPTVFWKREVYEKCGGFDESLQLVADCDYWMRIGEQYPVHKLNEMLAIERNHHQAKRLSQAKNLSDEIQQVRARYVKTEGVGHVLGTLVNRTYISFFYRYYSLRFLLDSLRWGSSIKDTGWAGFLTSGRGPSVSARSALAVFLPFKRGFLVCNHVSNARSRVESLTEPT